MIVQSAFYNYASLFKQHGIPDAADEARVLICHVLKISTADFFAMPGRCLTDAEQFALSVLAERCLDGEPMAYVTGYKEFYGIDLYVDSRVLLPRPETETLVEEALKYSKGKTGRHLDIADVGTGSGAIAIALALNLTNAFVFAIDISATALEVAQSNVWQYGLEKRVKLLNGDLLLPLPQPVDVLVANLPYIAENELRGLPEEILRYEPIVALNGGVEGTAVINRLLGQVEGKIKPGGIILLEIGLGQEEQISEVAKGILQGSKISLCDDLAGIKRVVKIIAPIFDMDK